MDQAMIEFITNQGFAIAVAMYSLIRLEKAMKDNTEIMRDLTTLIKGGGKIE